MLALLLALCAHGGEVLAAASLAALPPAERESVLVQALLDSAGDPEESARISAALGVCRAREEDVEPYLRAALYGEAPVRSRAVEAARTGDPAPIPGAPLRALQVYRDQRLTRFGYSELQVASLHPTGSQSRWATARLSWDWTVSDGAGRVLTVPDFARAVGDLETLGTLDRSRRGWTWGGTALAIAGAGVVGTTIAWQQNHADWWRDGTGTMIMAAGVGAFVVGISGPLLESNRRRRVDRWYEVEEVDAWIASHNAALQERLDLTEAEVREVELEAGTNFKVYAADPTMIAEELQRQMR